MTERIDVKITADGSGLVRGAKDAEAAIKRLGSTINTTGSTSKTAFAGVAASAKNLNFASASKDAKDLGSAISGIGKSLSVFGSVGGEVSKVKGYLGSVETEARRVGAAMAKALAPKATIGAVGGGVAGGAAGAGATLTALVNVSTAMENVSNVTQMTGDAFGDLALKQKEASDGSVIHTAAIIASAVATARSAEAQTRFRSSLQETLAETEKNINLTTQLAAAKADLQRATDAEVAALEAETQAQKRFDESRGIGLENMKATAAAYDELQLATERLNAAMADTETAEAKVNSIQEQLKASTDGVTGSHNQASQSSNLLKDSFATMGKELMNLIPGLDKVVQFIGPKLSGVIEAGAARAPRLVGALAGIGSVAAPIAGVAAAIGLVAVAIGKAADAWAQSDMAKEVMDAEGAATGLAAAFSGVEYQLTTISPLIDSLAEGSKKFDSDAIAKAATQLKLLGGNESEINKLLPAITSIAEVMNVDVADAAEKVGLGFEGSTRALRSMGIVVEEGATSMDIMNAVMKRGETAQKQLALQGGSTTSSINRLKKAGEDLSEAWGTMFAPLGNWIAGVVAGAEEKLAGFISWLNNTMGLGLKVPKVESAAPMGPEVPGFLRDKGKKDQGKKGSRTEQDVSASTTGKAGGTGGKGGRGGLTFELPKETAKFAPEFLKKLEERVGTLFSASSLDALGAQLLRMPLSLDTMKQAIEIVGKRFAELDQQKLQNLGAEIENLTQEIADDAKAQQDYAQYVQEAKDALNNMTNAIGQAITGLRGLYSAVRKGDIGSAIGLSGELLAGALGGPVAPIFSALMGVLSEVVAVGDEEAQKRLDMEAANQELFRQNLEKFGISVENMGQTQKSLAVKLGLKTEPQARLEQARETAKGALTAGGFGEVAGVVGDLTESQVKEISSMIAGGDLEGAASRLYAFAGKTRPMEVYRPAVPQIYQDYGITMPDVTTAAPKPLTPTEQATLTTAFSTLLDGIMATLGVDTATAPGQVAGNDPKNPIYVYDVTPAEEQFMFAPRSYFFRAAAESRAVMG
jgi:hypothetical protein